MDPTQAVASFTAISAAIKKAREVAKAWKDAEVQAILLDAQERALDLKEELVNLRAENAELREQLKERQAVTFEGGAYWSGTGGSRDGPFCNRCSDVDRRLVRMKPTHERWHECPECKRYYEVTSAPQRPPEPPSSMEIERV